MSAPEIAGELAPVSAFFVDRLAKEISPSLIEAIPTISLSDFQALVSSSQHAEPPQLLPPRSYLLLNATKQRRLDIVRYILSLYPSDDWAAPDAAPFAQVPQYWRSFYISAALHEAIESDDPALVQTFLDAGWAPDRDVVDEHEVGASLLEIAVKEGRLAAAECLLKAGADPNQRMIDSPRTLVAEAAGLNAPDTLRLLLRCGGNVGASMALYEAAASDAVEAAEVLLEAGADVNEILAFDGWDNSYTVVPSGADGLGENVVGAGGSVVLYGTALHSAVLSGQERFVKWLLEKGANVEVKNGDGKTAADIAESEGSRDLKDLITGWDGTA